MENRKIKILELQKEVLKTQLEIYSKLVLKMNETRKYYVLFGFLMGVGFWGLVTMYFN